MLLIVVAATILIADNSKQSIFSERSKKSVTPNTCKVVKIIIQH